MEVAIPVIALGAMYVISNQDKREEVLNKENLPIKRNNNYPIHISPLSIILFKHMFLCQIM